MSWFKQRLSFWQRDASDPRTGKSPGHYGRCMRCQTGWDLVKGHTTWYEQGRGCFPLCERCFDESHPEERIHYYRELWFEWLRGCGSEAERQYRYPESLWAGMEAAVRAESEESVLQ